MAPIIETPEGEVILTKSHMSDETRRSAEELAKRRLDGFWGQPCCICRRSLFSPDLAGAQLAGVGRDGRERVAHVTCWQGFVELLQTLPPQRLYELISETGSDIGKETNGQQQIIERGAE